MKAKSKAENWKNQEAACFSIEGKAKDYVQRFKTDGLRSKKKEGEAFFKKMLTILIEIFDSLKYMKVALIKIKIKFKKSKHKKKNGGTRWFRIVQDLET